MSAEDGTRNDFLCLYLADLDAGRRRTLAEYQALFPDAAELVAEELARLAAEDEPPPEETSFGSYRLIRELGRGGQGTVYLAEDSRLERRVALKVMPQLPFAGEESRRRFEREARVASRLDDSGICTVHETGEVGGTPFIAMRFVEGESLQDKIAAARDVGAAEVDVGGPIALLFERIAKSLHRAHESGIVHRDVKPGNVMVKPDGEPVLLDFGLARAQDEALPTLTRTGDLFGTPAYMAPELLREGPSTERSVDVYALGVMLYECLTLKRPYEAPTREGLYRAILEDEPLDPAAARPGLPADLRLVVLTAIAQDPARRYRTAADLAEDLRRFRVGEPILARAPSATYRVRRFVSRHRIVVGATVVVVLGLATATAVTAAALIEARDERAVAEETLVAFEDILLSASHGREGRDVRLLDVLDDSASRLADQLGRSPDAGARLSGAVGRVYAGLGELAAAEELLVRAHATLRERHGENDERTLAALHDLGRLRIEQGRLDEAERHLTRVVEERRRMLGADHVDTLRAVLDVAALRVAEGDHAQAEELLLDVRARESGELVYDALTELGHLRQAQGRWEEALELQSEVLARLEESRGPDHTDTSLARANLGTLYLELGRHPEAEELFEEALAVERAKVGRHAPRTAVTAGNLALLYKQQKRYEEAERLYLEVLADEEEGLGEGHPHTLDTANDLGRLYQATGDLEQGERFIRRAYEGSVDAQGAAHPKTLIYRNNLGLVLHDMKRLDEAEEELTGALAGRESLFGPDHSDTLKSMNNLAYLYLDLGRTDEAREMFERSLAGRRRALGESHPDTILAMVNLGWFHERQGALEEAARWYRDALDVCDRDEANLASARIVPQRLLASAAFRLGRLDEAQALALDLLERLPEGSPDREGLPELVEAARGSREEL